MPTEYNGILFRSRTEARWAFVFEQFGWTYFYEQETYSLAEGLYLPDFFIPKLDLFFEVKGEDPTADELLKASSLCVATEKYVAVSSGPPNHRRTQLDNDIYTFSPERDCVNDEPYADWHKGGFVFGRWSDHPVSSLHLGNLVYLPVLSQIDWQTAFSRAANARFGVYEHRND